MYFVELFKQFVVVPVIYLFWFTVLINTGGVMGRGVGVPIYNERTGAFLK